MNGPQQAVTGLPSQVEPGQVQRMLQTLYCCASQPLDFTRTFHKLSPKRLNRSVAEFAGKHNLRDPDTLAQLALLAAGVAGKRLLRHDLIAADELSSRARS